MCSILAVCTVHSLQCAELAMCTVQCAECTVCIVFGCFFFFNQMFGSTMVCLPLCLHRMWPTAAKTGATGWNR